MAKRSTCSTKRWPSERFIPIATAHRRGKGGERLLLWHQCRREDGPNIRFADGTGWYVATTPQQSFEQAFAIEARELVRIRRTAA